jgi:hypothetical protein
VLQKNGSDPDPRPGNAPARKPRRATPAPRADRPAAILRAHPKAPSAARPRRSRCHGAKSCDRTPYCS